ncbi:YhcN/YlaJ family sporulation lipoprotein [Virgibacillus kekensis]|uniref:YhcN/YlaJ family sporulation lipoprotein n=1 Tax=Virgibacillus kekensis TaxID=202261 RepID=A0ABV9DJU4_9BACI
MKKKVYLSAAILLTAMLTACGGNDNAADEHEQIVNELDPEQENQNPGEENKLGYVRYTKEQIENDNERNHTVRVDRTKLANMITRIILRSEGFNEVATLVTDEVALIAYSKDEALDSSRAADTAKKTAVSVLPGYYDIYVSDNATLMSDIQSLHNSSVLDNSYDKTVERIINEMKKTPQGNKK